MHTILVVDDEQAMREQIAKVLEYEGYRPITAENGDAAVHLARQTRPDLIISDVMMPGLSGYGVLEALSKDPLTAAIPFIFLTGLSDRRDVRHGMALGADDFLPKPFETEELVASVRARLDKRARETRRIEALRENISRSLPHELRTPLTGILGITDYLLDHDRATPIEPETLFPMLEGIRESGRRLERLMENYLLYAMLQLLDVDVAERRRFTEVAPVSSALVIAFGVSKLAEKAGRTADVDLRVTDADVRMDEAYLWKIVAELLDNAFKFSEPGTPVRVESRIQGGSWMLTVADRGRGMTDEQIDAIGAYIQFDRQRYEQQGVGLGLTLVRLLAELYGGTVDIHGVPEQGTTVTVTLPGG